LVHFSFKTHVVIVVATILMIFLRINSPNFGGRLTCNRYDSPPEKKYFPRHFPGNILLPTVNEVDDPGQQCRT